MFLRLPLSLSRQLWDGERSPEWWQMVLSWAQLRWPVNQFLINVPLLSVTGVLPFRPCRLFLCLTFIVFDFVISTFFSSFILFPHLCADRREFLPMFLGSGVRTQLFCLLFLLHPSLQIKTLSFCVITRLLGLGVPFCNTLIWKPAQKLLNLYYKDPGEY